MIKSDTINELAQALCKAQAAMKGAVKDSQNPFYKSKYADLSSVWDAVKEALHSNGLSVSQLPDCVDGKNCVTTILMHTSGQYIGASIEIKPVKEDPQAVGSAITYARRYSLAAICGIAPADDDDDAEGAMSRQTSTPAKKHLTVTELIEKMQTATNAFELNARRQKYKPDYDALTLEDQVKVRMAADKRKTELKETANGNN